MENTNWRAGFDLSWSGAAMSCPTHMSRFLTESLGLCISIESASAYGWNPLDAILDADRLPKSDPLYVASGSRPDFIVQTTAGWHGIEARGRGAFGPVGPKRPVAAQNKKLVGMHNWSAEVAKHKRVAGPPAWSMSWAWITNRGTRVDHFDPGDPVELSGRDANAVWRSMSEIASTLAEVDDVRVRRVQALDRSVSVVSRPIQDNTGNDDARWLMVASWSERMTRGELRDRRQLGGGWGGDVSQDLVSALDSATVGAFMATAITDRPPQNVELAPLLRTIAHMSSEPADNDDGPVDG